MKVTDNDKLHGCAFLCNEGGVIINVLRDDFNMVDRACEGKLFNSIFEQSSQQNALNLLLEAKDRNVAFNYQLEFAYRDQIKSLYFLGVHINNQLLFIGADNQNEAITFISHLQQINNEQSNLIRTLVKESVKLSRPMNKESSEIFDEITRLNNELVNLQRDLSKKNIELENLNQLKNRFLGMVVHDLRNPLNVIQSFSEFLIDQTKDSLSEKHRNFIDIIHEAADSMLTLVEELLEVTKTESGLIHLNTEEFDFLRLVKKNINLLNTIATKKNITIEIESNIPQLAVIADPKKTEQVITNLLSNAIKFSYPDSTILFKIEEHNHYFTFSVSDTGIGISKEDQDKLFMPFQKIEAEGTAGEKSTGLGLYIIKRIIDAHQGKIWLESEKEKGTTFFASIPKKPLH